MGLWVHRSTTWVLEAPDTPQEDSSWDILVKTGLWEASYGPPKCPLGSASWGDIWCRFCCQENCPMPYAKQDILKLQCASLEWPPLNWPASYTQDRVVCASYSFKTKCSQESGVWGGIRHGCQAASLPPPHGKAGRRWWLTCGALGEWPGEGRQQGSVAGQPLARVEEGQEVRAVREWKGEKVKEGPS